MSAVNDGDNDTQAELAAWELLKEAREERDNAQSLARELRDALDGVIFSASPNRRENPTMFAAWEEARPILAKAKEVLI